MQYLKYINRIHRNFRTSGKVKESLVLVEESYLEAAQPPRVNALLQIKSQTCIEINGISVFHALFTKHMYCMVIITKLFLRESLLVHFSLGFHARSAEKFWVKSVKNSVK